MTLTHPLGPMFAMTLLTAVVWVRLLLERVGEIKRRRIPLDQIASSHQLAATLVNTQSSDNFKNLFEMPVLLYVLCLALDARHVSAPDLIAGAWAFVALRVAHSVIHCTSNNVRHRYRVYWVSSVLLWGLWADLGWRLLFQEGI
jgi:hypothetical protein